MEKIKALMVKLGLSEELADRLCESIEADRTRYRQECDAEYKAREEEAKRVCLEEVESHKRELARRLQIFCEARAATIDQTVAKQSALKESDALSKLRGIMDLLEGLEPNGEPNGKLQAENKKLKRRVQQLQETAKKQGEQVNRANAIAEKALGRARRLEQQLAESNRRNGAPVQESRRIDHGRRGGGQPSTTRPTLRENQDRTPRRPAETTVVRQGDGFPTPSELAATLDENP